MAVIGDSYFENIPESSTSKKASCILYKGSSYGVLRTNDTIELIIKKIVSKLKTDAVLLSRFVGYSGYSGYSGYGGATGSSGYSGFSGESGYSESGHSGYSGYNIP